MRRLLLALALFCASACNSRNGAEVSGVLKLNGAPLPDAVVSFLPDPDKNTDGPRSTGVTDAEGKFRLRFDDGVDGAVVGFHRVLVHDRRAVAGPRKNDGKPVEIAASRVAKKYETAGTTPLRQEVKRGPQTVTIELTSD